MPPMYKDELLENSYTSEDGRFVVYYGQLPNEFDLLNTECNLLTLQKNYLCEYQVFSNGIAAHWNILEMGLYRDTLSADEVKRLEVASLKKMEFSIPFEKNQSSFSQEDIQPIYDSLNLTNYTIKEIRILAYTSVEGSYERNMELQKERANSIVKALQAYQSDSIRSKVIAKENWREFAKDIKGTEYKFLLEKPSKELVRTELNNNNELLAKLEPILEKHRKGLVRLVLEKRFLSEHASPQQIKKYFDQSIKSKDLPQAIHIQNILFLKARHDEIPNDFIGKLDVPQESDFAPLLNNYAVFNFDDGVFLFDNISAFENLLKIAPNSPQIIYNLTSLNIQAWALGLPFGEHHKIKKLIDRLKTLEFEASLIKRLEINYLILLTQHYQLTQEYDKKNRTIRSVYNTYKSLDISNQEVLSLAKYLVAYRMRQWSEELLLEKLQTPIPDEELLFYYLSLTIHKRDYYSKADYQLILKKVIEINKGRFCRLFLPVPQGGNTFQLLGEKYLQHIYCKECNGFDF
ncbi:hypothetical protein R9C00_12895 [Flammeovirgaceae bacterium SG7u.111]|nr:hypothetical protein [Flammeovirgaceae bacterium SG7u.132]WPO38352.1 hypothetical protein R9C00_12895 [Flammeovirgaceae bacterium SG7u.111]